MLNGVIIIGNKTLATRLFYVPHTLHLKRRRLLGLVGFALDADELALHNNNPVRDASYAERTSLRAVVPDALGLQHPV